jgi:hypothetical protein
LGPPFPSAARPLPLGPRDAVAGGTTWITESLGRHSGRTP